MAEGKGREPKAERLGRRALSARAAAVVLGVVVIAVGAVGFVALSAVSHTSSASQHSCSPPSSPQCTAKSHAITELHAPGGLLALARGG